MLSERSRNAAPPLADQPVTLVVEDPSGQHVNVDATSLANGFYSFTLNEVSPGHYGYQTDFPGDNA